MELNRLVFPCPPSTYTHESLEGRLIYVPKRQEDIFEETEPLSPRSPRSSGLQVQMLSRQVAKKMHHPSTFSTASPVHDEVSENLENEIATTYTESQRKKEERRNSKMAAPPY